ncbi:hypothetical protein G4O51_08015 [Candidatus Bathyarchaeota archaeon A05DMB-2]|nr:hypothetical protein [Candidatus Bathyarchaeota archaeon A05DMB-2]
MLKKETIKERAVSAVHIKVLPLRRKNGRGIAGKCNTTRGRIHIYPKTTKFCRIFTRKFGRNTLLAYVGNRARAALIHELLHLKYIEDEKTVMELAKEYFYIFTREHFTQSAYSLVICTMIFNAKISGKRAPPSVSYDPSIRLRLTDTCLRASGVFN